MTNCASSIVPRLMLLAVLFAPSALHASKSKKIKASNVASIEVHLASGEVKIMA